ncbi:CopG family ribbon-helix-helix protein [Candidatus Bathyarchaeota archaeon]|nr:CopG family ribbon-helix-helix protein [Candidatus Bathyarchaeota archaeon]
MTIISLSIPETLLEQVDSAIVEKGFASRSEITRQALRLFLKEDIQIENLEGEIVATATIIFKEKADRDRLLDAQHVYGGLVLTFLHAHIHEGFCLEVIILKGEARTIRKFVDELRTNEQITQINIAVLAQL